MARLVAEQGHRFLKTVGRQGDQAIGRRAPGGQSLVLLLPVIAGIGVGLLRGGSIRRLADLRFRLGWLAILCLLVQFVVAYYPVDRMETDRLLQAVLLTGSYVLLLAVVWANRRVAGVAVVGLGLVLNLAVIAANGGFMPVAREDVEAAGIRPAAELPADGSRLPRSKDILLPTGETRLWFLSDKIVAPGIATAKVYSVGDLIVGLGAFLLLQGALLSDTRGRVREAEQPKTA